MFPNFRVQAIGYGGLGVTTISLGEVYGTPYPDIPPGFKAIAFREQRPAPREDKPHAWEWVLGAYGTVVDYETSYTPAIILVKRVDDFSQFMQLIL